MHDLSNNKNLLPPCMICLMTLIFITLSFQLGIDIGSSTVARGVVSLVLGYLNNLVIEMAFLIQVRRLVIRHLQGQLHLNDMNVFNIYAEYK